MKHIACILTIFGLIGFSHGKANAQCVADFVFTTNQLEVFCQNTSMGNYTAELWSFGDGTVPSTTSSHTYATPGTYEVCLTVTNILAGCFDFVCYDVTVTEFTCVVDFSYSFNSANVFQFQNNSSPNFTSVEWSFGDGNVTTFANPSYTYNIPGTYEVCLTLFDEENVCGEDCMDIDVYPLGLSEVENGNFTVYPNPSERGEFYIEYQGITGMQLQLEVIDIAGRRVHSQTTVLGSALGVVRWNAVSGSYFIKATDEDGNVTMKKVLVL